MWPYIGDTIKFATDGTMLDGQHRCLAVIESGVPHFCIRADGVEPESFVYIDGGGPRTAGNALHIARLTHPTLRAAATGWIYRYENELLWGGRCGIPLSKMEILDYNMEHREDMDRAVEVVYQYPMLKELYTRSLAIAFVVLTNRIDPVTSELFWRKLALGTDLTVGDPILTLRNRLIRTPRDGTQTLADVEHCWTTIRAWNAVRSDAKLNTLVRPQKMPKFL